MTTPATPDGVKELPELPLPVYHAPHKNICMTDPTRTCAGGDGLYTADQMHAYARAAMSQHTARDGGGEG